MNLMYPVSTEEPRYAGIGPSDDRRLHDPAESITANVGDLSGDVKESGSNELETALKSSDASDRSQRGHSSRSTGKPCTGRRATAYQVLQSTTMPLYTGESRLGGIRKRR
jgi:hypothetical protein